MLPEKIKAHYEKIFSTRWASIYDSLLREEIQLARWNIWAGDEALRTQQMNLQKMELSQWSKELQGFTLKANQKVVPQATSAGVLDFYVMDPASVVVALNVGVQEGHRVLDMCAAPGGKTLVLFEKLKESGELIANDTSEARRERMKKVIQSYIPRLARERLFIHGKDGGLFGVREPEAFDRVLVDAPCSGERHLLSNSEGIKEWTPNRSESLAYRQFSLLSSAFLCTKVGGFFVYSTCALSPTENDEVVAKLLDRRKENLELDEVKDFGLPGVEKTKLGLIFMPDRCGFGPLYMSRIKKIKAFR